MMTEPANDASQTANNRLALRRVARACGKAALATLMADGSPYASLVTVTLDHDLAPILLLSGLSDHTRNLAADARVSLLFDGTAGLVNPQTGPRVTLTGRARPSDDKRLAARFLARHPGAALYAGFGDFAFWRVAPERAHFVGGFGRAVWFDPPFGIAAAAATAMAAAEADILAHINADHAEAVGLYATRLAGGTGDGWILSGVDTDGIDLAQGESILRLCFPNPVVSPDAVRDALVELTKRARA